MLTQLTSFATLGLSCEKITVEVGCYPGEAKILIVGLGDLAVQESKQRVKHAIRASGYKLSTGKVVTVNLAPTDLKKVGPRYDLPIALGLLLSQGLIHVPEDTLKKMAFLGELALDGTLRHVTSILPAAIACRERGIETLVVPEVNGAEAALVPGINVIAPKNLQEIIHMLTSSSAPEYVVPSQSHESYTKDIVDFSDIRGQQQAKRALEIAAAGGHNVLLSGSPGSGKTLLAKALRGILPPLTREEALEVTQIYSVANLLSQEVPLVERRPFRTVHHTASGVSIVGGGQIPGPGEVSLAHRGVLFLDELAEFPTPVLEVLRQPLEDRRITITRTHGCVTFPADVLLVAAMNPPQYSSSSSQRMAKRISAPFLDRIDLTIDVQAVPIEELQEKQAPSGETSKEIMNRVRAARERQRTRFANRSIMTNKEMDIKDIRDFCVLSPASEKLLKQAAERLDLSARSYHRIIKVARTIADLQGSDAIDTPHVAEALQYRQDIGLNKAS